MQGRLLGVGVAVAMSVHAGSVRAEPPGEAAPAGADPAWSPLGVVVDVGFLSGLAVGGQTRAGTVGARITGGWNPLFIVVSNADTLKVEQLNYYSSLQLNADVFALPLEGAPGARFGIVGGYKYNSVLGHGVQLGFEAQIRRSAHFSVHVQLGVAFFPSGSDRLMRDKQLPSGVEYNFPFGGGFQSGGTIGVVLHP